MKQWVYNNMEQAPFNIILLGDPASGKGTQGVRLIKRYDLHDLDMGNEVRKSAVRAQFNYAKTTGMGKLTPTVIVRNIFANVIAKTSARKGILFNGNPKMINEAKLVKRLLKQSGRRDPLVIYITLPEKETIARMHGRGREDDTLKALKNRQKYYKEQVSQVVRFFKDHYVVKNISGMGSETVVAKRIEEVMETYIKNHGA